MKRNDLLYALLLFIGIGLGLLVLSRLVRFQNNLGVNYETV